MNDNIYVFCKKIKTKVDFEKFLKLLSEDCKNKNESWENASLQLFLDALHGYNFDSKNDPKEVTPTWKLFAEMLLAAKVYE